MRAAARERSLDFLGCCDGEAAGLLSSAVRSRPGSQPVIYERMILLDINTFFAEKAGGIRTFYRAKISFFERQLAHRYYLSIRARAAQSSAARQM